MKWGWDVKWTGLGCRNMSRSFFPTCEGSQCLSCGAVMCQLRFWNFKQWPPASAHGHKSSSGKKMKNYLWTQSFCVRGFLFPSEMGRFHLFFLGPKWWFPSWCCQREWPQYLFQFFFGAISHDFVELCSLMYMPLVAIVHNWSRFWFPRRNFLTLHQMFPDLPLAT
jgi:hypothetical protein